MTKYPLRQRLAQEVEIWSAKDYETLLKELADTASYERGEGCEPRQDDVLKC